jgi:Na+/H+-dicarboxylate symporter
MQGLSLILFIGVLIGIFNFEDFDIFGHSGIRTIAAIAVMGCLLAAIGLNDIKEE